MLMTMMLNVRKTASKQTVTSQQLCQIIRETVKPRRDKLQLRSLMSVTPGRTATF